MRPFLALLLSFQFINAPLAAELGEKEEFSIKKTTLNQLAEAQRNSFSEDALAEMAKLSKLGLAAYAKGVDLPGDDRKLLQAELALVKGEKLPVFMKKAEGEWEAVLGKNKLTMSLEDIYLQQVVLNGTVLTYKGLSFTDLKQKVQTTLTSKTSITQILRNQFLIADAHAMEPISAVVILVIAAAILGTAVYYMHYKPKKTVEKIKAAAQALKAKADACEGSAGDQSSYDATFSLANNISDRAVYNSVTSAENALNLQIKKQLQSGTGGASEEGSCGASVSEGMKKAGMDVPSVSDLNRAQQRREALGRPLEADSETDVSGAMMGLCSTYNRLASCMDQFVRRHVSDGVENFKDNAEQNYYRYRQRAGAAGQ